MAKQEQEEMANGTRQAALLAGVLGDPALLSAGCLLARLRAAALTSLCVLALSAKAERFGSCPDSSLH